MNQRWLLIRRLRGPAYLLTFAVTALLHQWDILSFGQSWPLYLIVAGILALAERAALAGVSMTPYPGAYPGAPGSYAGPYPGQPYGAAPNYGQPYGTPYQPVGNAVVPVAPAGIEGFHPGDPNDPHPKPGGRF